MKNQLLSLLLAIGLISLNGCSNLDEGNYEFAYENALEYEWHLTRRVGGFGVYNADYGDIIYDFDTENSILTVENSLAEDGNNGWFLPTGSYEYEIIEFEEHTYIIIEELMLGPNDDEIRGARIEVFDSGVLTIDIGFQATTTAGYQVIDANLWRFQRYP